MGFFGLSDTGRNAQGRIGELPEWSYQGMKQWGGRSNDAADRANELFYQTYPYYKDIMSGNAYGTQPWQNWGTGKEAMPGVDEALQKQQENLGDLFGSWEDFSGGPGGAKGTTDQLNDWIDQWGGNVANNTNDIANMIGGTYDTASGRNAALSPAMMEQLAKQYGNLGDMLNSDYNMFNNMTASTYDPLVNFGGNLYGDLNKSLTGTYKSNRDVLRGLQPGGDLQAATVARSFAPNVIATMDRLRAAGVDPNSPQAQGALSNIERQRAQGMDEATLQNTRDYIDRATQLNLGEQAGKERLGQAQLEAGTRLGTSKLNTLLGLGTQRNALASNIAREQGQGQRDEMLRNFSQATGLDLSRLGANTTNTNRTIDLVNQYLQQRMNNSQLNRQMGLQDWGTKANLLDKSTAAAMGAPGYRYQQYQAGFNQNAYNQGLKDAAAKGMSGQEAQQYAMMLATGRMGMQENQNALRDYLTSLGIEGQNAGWGSKLLIGLLPSLLSLGMGGGGASSGGGGWGGFGTGGI